MEKTKPLVRLWNLLVSEKREITSIYFYAILSGLLQLSVPIGVQAIIGFVLGASMVTSIYVLITVVIVAVLLVGVMQINQMKIIEKVQQQIFTGYAFKFAEAIPRFDLKKTDNYYLPEKVNRFFDILSIQKGLSKVLLEIPTASIQVLFGLILLSLYHPVFIVFGFLLIAVLYLILKITSKKGLTTSLRESAYKYAVAAWLEEMARVIKSFKFSHGSSLNLTKTDHNVSGYLEARTEHFKVLLFQYRTLVMFKVGITTAMLVVGTYLLLNQELNIGEFIAAEIVIITVIGSVEKLIGSLDSVYDVVTGLEKLAMVTEMPAEKDGNLSLGNPDKGLKVEVIDFSFNYSNGKKLFNNLNFIIPSNSKVCISGPEGAGKTSLLRVMNGSYSDFEGSILINNVPIGNYQLESLRNHTGVYLNQMDVFVGTVFENITMGKTKISPERIIEIADNIGFHDFLHTLQEGFDTQIDPMGKRLSGSMVKKILLLRALAEDPELILLEEPWLGFDETKKQDIISYLLNTLNNVTVIVASNDQEFAEKCDYQIVLENGTATLINKK